MEGWLFPGIGENFTQLEVAKSSAWTAILSVTVQGFQFNHRETLVDSEQKMNLLQGLGQPRQSTGRLCSEVRLGQQPGMGLESQNRADPTRTKAKHHSLYHRPSWHLALPGAAGTAASVHPRNLCSACNCHHVQRGTSSALFASLATDLGQAGASRQQNLGLLTSICKEGGEGKCAAC